MRIRYTKEMEDFIISRLDKMSNKDIKTAFEKEFGVQLKKESIHSFMVTRGIKREKLIYPRRVFTEEVAEFLLANYKMRTSEELAKMATEKFGTKFNAEQMKGFRNRNNLKSGLTGRFEKGHVSKPHPNAGKHENCKKHWFKKGHTPGNHKEVGSIRLTKDGYYEIKTAEPNKWELLHRYNWEQANGKLKAGECVCFLDTDPKNCNIDNLRLVTRKELALINKKECLTEDAKLNDIIINTAKLKTALRERSRNGCTTG